MKELSKEIKIEILEKAIGLVAIDRYFYSCCAIGHYIIKYFPNSTLYTGKPSDYTNVYFPEYTKAIEDYCNGRNIKYYPGLAMDWGRGYRLQFMRDFLDNFKTQE